MKMRVHENTGQVYFTADNADENFKLGVIAAKLKGHSYPPNNDGKHEVCCDLKDLIELITRI